MMKSLIKKARVVGLMLLVLLSVAFGVASIQEQTKPEQKRKPEQLIASVKGPDLFRAYCASCHGDDGTGNGPVAPALNVRPADLTTIAQRHGGVFPSQRVRNMIAGDDLILAHGSREMPIWGPIFHQIERDQDLGNVRMQNIVKYIESIQRK
jgi:mono/diheme cytochrome c family protein